MRECEKNGGFGDKRKCWEYIILMLLVLLSTLSNGTAEKIKEIDVHVCQGQDAYFNLTSQYPILHARFGEKKEGKMGPDPLVIRVDEYNKPHEDIKVYRTTYSDRLTIGERIHNGSLVFILHNTQVNDSRTFLALYLQEVGQRTSPYDAVEFKLQVEDNCTNMATEPPTPKPSANGPDVMTTTHTPENYPNNDMRVNSTDGISPDNSTDEPFTNSTLGTRIPVNKFPWQIVGPIGSAVLSLFIILIVYCCYKKKKKAQNVIANEEFPLQRRSSEKFVQQNASGIDNDPEDPVIRGQDNLDDEAVEEYVDSEFGEIRMELELDV